jgi:hypothetical protein
MFIGDVLYQLIVLGISVIVLALIIIFLHEEQKDEAIIAEAGINGLFLQCWLVIYLQGI